VANLTTSIRLPYKNLAKDPDILRMVESELVPLLQQIRDNRIRLEEKWQRYYRIWNCELDKNSYSGRSKIYLAAARATCETWTSAIVRDFYPASDNWFEVINVDQVADEMRADSLEHLFYYFFKKQQKLKSDSLPLIRQLVTYGTSPGKLMFADKDQMVTALKLMKDGKSYEKVTQNVKYQYGPMFRPRSIFNFYAWPETAPDVQEADVAFEDIEVSLAHIREMAAKPMNPKNEDLGMVYEVPEEVYTSTGSSERNRDWFRFRKEKLQKMGISTDPSDRWSDLGRDKRNLTECYWRRDIDGTGEKEWLLTIINDWNVVRIQENPYWHKQKPFFVPRLLRVIDEFYGRGIMDTIDRVQYMINDMVNQTMDSVQYELNPITIVDPGSVAYSNSIRFHPGAKWLMADPQRSVVFTKPASVAAVGFQTLSLLQGFIQDFSGANAALQGQPAVRGRGRAQNTASGMSAMISQGSMPMTQIIEDLEEQFGEPLLAMSYSLIQQFMNDKIMLRILGRRGAPLLQKEVGIEDIIGNYEFNWLGSIASKNRQILGQQMINFLNIARGLPPEVLQQLNWQWLVKKIWTEGLGLKDAPEMFNPNGYTFSVDPELEFRLNHENREIKVSPGDDNQKHLKQHYLDRAEIKDEQELERWDKHIEDTTKALQAQIAQVEQQKQLQQLKTIMEVQGQNGGGGKDGQQKGGARPQNQPSAAGGDQLSALMQQLQGGGIQ
jgi:hypothetical protein